MNIQVLKVFGPNGATKLSCYVALLYIGKISLTFAQINFYE